MTSELPESWESVRLGEVLDDIVGGGTPSKSNPGFFQGSIPLMTVKDMRHPRPTSTGFNITEEALASSSAKLVPEDTIIIATRMGLGKVVRPTMDTAINQDLKALFPNEALDKSYLEQWLVSIASKIEAMGTGTTVKGVRLNQIRELILPLAPIEEQRGIVEKIETLFAELDKGEESLRQVQTLLARYRQSVLKAAVTEFAGSSERVQLGQLLDDIRYGTAKRCRAEVEGVPVLRIPNVVTGQIDLEDLKFAELDEKEMSRLRLTRGDVLLVRSNGSANLVGRTAVVDDRAAGMAFAGYLIRLRVDRNRLLPEFLHIVLNSPEVRAKIERQARSTSGVHNINSTEVRAIEFDLPTVATQSEIVEQVGEQVANADLLEAACIAELSRSAALRQSILKDAFSGRLVPQDPNDEPAAELLARVRRSQKAGRAAKR